MSPLVAWKPEGDPGKSLHLAVLHQEVGTTNNSLWNLIVAMLRVRLWGWLSLSVGRSSITSVQSEITVQMKYEHMNTWHMTHEIYFGTDVNGGQRKNPGDFGEFLFFPVAREGFHLFYEL